MELVPWVVPVSWLDSTHLTLDVRVDRKASQEGVGVEGKVAEDLEDEEVRPGWGFTTENFLIFV